ncbi:hypothetical protein M434DRAFT_38356 [Hypoxylon sp. CO27-5]|nr:hypothetical protein M434DRAFT_38356 [Hypoxylon sp. CO27-5]
MDEPPNPVVCICEDSENEETIIKIQQLLTELVYASNYIDFAGLDYNITEKLCQKITRGERVATRVESGDPEYAQAEAALIALTRPFSFSNIMRSRDEVINHIGAFAYAIKHIIFNKELITEGFLKEVHLILCADIRFTFLGEDNEIRGEYRTWEIADGHEDDVEKKSVFIRASAVPLYMEKFVEDLQGDVLKAERDPTFNRLDMATRYCHRFACIHPFGYGNDRLCRLLLNILLMHYTGHVIIFGDTESERDEYLDIMRRCNKRFHEEEDMEVPEEDKKGYHELMSFTFRKAKIALE